MDSKTVAKMYFVAGALFTIASFILAWIMFAMRDGPIGAVAYLTASLLLGAGIILIVMAKNTYGRA